MPNTPDPLSNERLLRQAVERIAERHGINLEDFNIAVQGNLEDGPDLLNLMFTVKPETLIGKDKLEQIDFDEKFKAMMSGVDLGSMDERKFET